MKVQKWWQGIMRPWDGPIQSVSKMEKVGKNVEVQGKSRGGRDFRGASADWFPPKQGENIPIPLEIKSYIFLGGFCDWARWVFIRRGS